MEKDFHYNLTYSLLKIAGYNKADVIAYASQFVDDNNEGWFSIDGEKMIFPECIEARDGYYYPIMTQSLSPKSLDPHIQKYVYTPFHFMPGDNNVEMNGNRNPLSTTPNSQNARKVLIDALRSTDELAPYRIGIAMHTFSDTWSHQNFTGMRQPWNSVYPWYNVFKSIAPNIGHAEAGHSPDVISETWTDHRFDQTIDNRQRALDATRESYKLLRRFSPQGGKPWGDLESDYKKIIRARDYDQRRDMIDDFLLDNLMGTVPPYSQHKWIDDALDKHEDKVVMKEGFTGTDWYKFHQAAKVQFAQSMELVKDL